MGAIASLSAVFAQVGICAFGGGLSTLPLIEYHLVTKNHWLSSSQFNQVLALSQVTPGPIAINAATFVGYRQAGFLGSLAATMSLCAAPIAVLSLILLILKKAPAEQSKSFTAKLRPVVSGLLALSLVSPLTAVFGGGVKDSALLLLGILLINKVKPVKESPVIILFIFGILGMLLFS